MFNTRIPRRAAAIVVATFFVAGTAAAAAGGVLPTPFSAADDPVLVEGTDVDGTDVDSSLDGVTDDTGIDDPDGGEDDAADVTDDTGVDDHSQSSRDYGNCQAWLNGAANDPASDAFAHLADEAEEAGVTIDEYCTTVVADHRSEHGPDGTGPDDHAGDHPDDHADDHGGSMPSLPDQSHGNGRPTGSSVPDGRGTNSGSNSRGGGSGSAIHDDGDDSDDTSVGG